jgi:hypothetical protein
MYSLCGDVAVYIEWRIAATFFYLFGDSYRHLWSA